MRIQLENVSFTYPSGVAALQNVSLAIESGESVAILGENGAGKTTLAKHLNGLLKPDQGRVSIGDWDTSDHTVAELARRVGYVFQNPDEQLFERSVRREVAFGPRNLGRSEAEIEESVRRALARVDLEAQADTHPYDLHASQRKLVALAATLALDTSILILDEPTTGQDAQGVRRVQSILSELKQEGRTLVAISHDVDFCVENFERVVLMSEGRVLADGDAAEVLSQKELLSEAAVEAPQLLRLADVLQLPGSPRTVGEFVDHLERRREER